MEDFNSYSICANCGNILHYQEIRESNVIGMSWVSLDDGTYGEHVPTNADDYESPKFGSDIRAEILWTLSLDSNQTEDLGEAESFGWFAYFKDFCAILSADSQGFVAAVVYEGDGASDSVADHWTELEREYAAWLADD